MLSGFTLERWEDGPLVQLAGLALSVAALSRCGGPRGRLVRRRRSSPEGLSAQAHNVSLEGLPGNGRFLRHTRVTASDRGACQCRRLAGVRPAPRALEAVEEVPTEPLSDRCPTADPPCPTADPPCPTSVLARHDAGASVLPLPPRSEARPASGCWPVTSLPG
jgi:hypothetical protein